ncbi:MAG: mechanosensitive ion channel [Pyramidobacter sp.]|nr:mechanosensitive ion channel [Pyramidobacter sp.]
MKKKPFALALLLALSLTTSALAVDAMSLVTGGAASGTKETVSADVPALKVNTDPAPPYEPKADAEACAARAEEIGKLLDDWAALRTEEAAHRFGVSEEAVTRRMETLTTLKNAYPAVINALSRKKQIAAELAKHKSDASSPELALTEKPPYPLKFYDDYIDKLYDISSQIDEAQTLVDRAAANSEGVKKLIDDREAAWRLARDNYAKDRSPANAWELIGASYLLESARVQQTASVLVQENAAASLAARKLEHERQGSVRAYIRKNLDLSETSFEAQTAELAATVKKLETTRTELNRQYKRAADAYEAAQLKYAAARDEAKSIALVERDMREAEREHLHLELEHLQGHLVVLAARKRVWTLRYDLARGAADVAKIPETVKELIAEALNLDNELTDSQKDLLDLQSRFSAVQKLIDAGEVGDGRMAALRKTRAALQASIDNCLAYVSHLFSMISQERAFIAELQETYKTVSIWDKARAWWRSKGAALLNTELWQSGGYAVRLREFLIALALIVLGTWGAKRGIVMLLWLLSKRFPFDETSSRSLARLLSYIAGIAIFLGALHIVGIPLTAFAFLGGAVAIGIGFGTQNLFKNLMSGVLLLLKRPFRLGNVIEVGGVSGTVADIGVSSTLIRTFDEKEVVIPNSDLLEKQLVNWSLSDALLRCEINVGVEYGTPAKLVRETLLEIVAADPRILRTPEPWVCFADFGDSALNFTLYFWINQRLVKGTRIRSEIREKIQEMFEQKGIVMAYPHMDVSLRSSAPVPSPAGRDDDRSLQA